MIAFNEPTLTGKELEYIAQATLSKKMCGDGGFTQRCSKWLEDKTASHKVLLTTSCTHALEIAAILIGIKEGDEVIMPSFTFVSTANPFVLRGAKIVFVDIRPDTMNIDETLIEAAITPNTKAIIPVHYAGVACEMETIMEIAERHKLFVIEDAAQGLLASYKGKALGSIGHMGAISFHETKNIHCGEGGALLINDKRLAERAEIIREKGTDRSRFLRGMVDKYSWVDVGSSYLPSELNAAFLLAQLEKASEVTEHRKSLWNAYSKSLTKFAEERAWAMPAVPESCEHNGHMFYLKVKSSDERQSLIAYLKEHSIQSVFHYIPLHSSLAGKTFGVLTGEDNHTTVESDKLLRLPMHHQLTEQDIIHICEAIKKFPND